MCLKALKRHLLEGLGISCCFHVLFVGYMPWRGCFSWFFSKFVCGVVDASLDEIVLDCCSGCLMEV